MSAEAVCVSVRGSFGAYLEDTLPAESRRLLREHLTSCGECRRAAAAHDPTFLFARPPSREIPAGEAEQILASVRTGVALIEAERRLSPPARRRFGGLAAAAAMAFLTLLLPGDSSRSGREVAGVARVPAAAETTALSPAGLPAEAAAGAPGATVYDWNPGAGRDEPRVVWIVDQGLDI